MKRDPRNRELCAQRPFASSGFTLIHLVSIPISNTFVNPARSIAAAVYGGALPVSQLWVFIVAPILGAAVTGLIVRVLGRRVVAEHPRPFPLVATRHPAAPWLRPPPLSVEVVEIFLSALMSAGFRDEQAVDAYRAFSSFLLGQLLLESAVRGAETAPAEEPLDEGGADIPQSDGSQDLTGLPHVARLRPLLSEDRAEEEFEVSLESLLDRLDRELSQ